MSFRVNILLFIFGLSVQSSICFRFDDDLLARLRNVGKISAENTGKDGRSDYKNSLTNKENNDFPNYISNKNSFTQSDQMKKNNELKKRDTRRRRDPSSSSSEEGIHWKEQWKQKWMNIKDIATKMNASNKGAKVNMISARPWGVPCGDPNQHDMPWGSCMLAMECDPEFRIYRGDHFCGKTELVCCAILLNTYDMYHGFEDVSLSHSSLETDSEELKGRAKKDKKKRNMKKSKNRRKKLRRKRKKAIRKLIRKTIREISKILNRTYKLGTKARIRKTKQLKTFVKHLKKKYRQDRQSMKDLHDIELFKIDTKLKKGIGSVRDVNRELTYNGTFRKWVINGTLSKEGEKILREQYPELWQEIVRDIGKKTRRSNSRDENYEYKDYEEPKDYLDYDIEYGMLYQ